MPHMTHPAKILVSAFMESVKGMLPVDRMFDGVPDIVFFVKDAAGRYMAVNDTLATRCGLPLKEAALGLTAAELFPPPLGEEFALQDKEILAGGKPIRDCMELHLYPGGKRGWCLTYKEPIPSKDGGIAGICGISRDLQLPGDGGEYDALAAVIDHIHKHYDTPLRLPVLAEMAGLSVFQFDQRIRSLFHLTAGQYILKVRIDSACQMLSGSGKPIVEIALDCGYADQSSFSRQFKQAVGMSPMAYRRKMT